MPTFSEFLNLTLQTTDENENTWGDVANEQVFRFIERAVAGMTTVTLVAADVTLTIPQSTLGSPDGRAMMLNVTGTPSGAYNIIVPTAAAGQPANSFRKVYLVRHNLSNTQNFTVKTAAGVGVTLAPGDVKWVFCDGSEVYQVTQDLVATATNALSLGGVAAALYARLNQGSADGQVFTRSQRVARVTLTEAGGLVAVDAGVSNCFFLSIAGGWTLSNPTNPGDGQTIRILIKQAGGGGHVLGYGTQYRFPGGTPPVLSTAAGARDYLGLEYFAADAVWVGNLLKGV